MVPKEPKRPVGDDDKSGLSPRLVAAVVLGLLALLFVFQNNGKGTIKFLFVDVTTRIWLALLVTLLAGVAIGWLVRGSRQKK